MDELRQITEKDVRLIGGRQGSTRQKEARQHQFLELLVDAPSQRHALEQASVPNATFNEWKQDPAFAARLQRIKADRIFFTISQAVI